MYAINMYTHILYITALIDMPLILSIAWHCLFYYELNDCNVQHALYLAPHALPLMFLLRF